MTQITNGGIFVAPAGIDHASARSRGVRRTISYSAAIDLSAIVKSAHADTVDKVVDHFALRFLRTPLAAKDRAVMVEFLRSKLGSSTIQPSDKLESSLRELLYLVLSTPEYQLG